MKRRRVVTAAIAPISTQGSGHGVPGMNGGDPSGVYGYGVDSFSG